MNENNNELTEYAKYFLDCLRNNVFLSKTDGLTINDLLCKVEEDKTLLDLLCESNADYDDNLYSLIINNIEALLICVKHNRFDWCWHIDSSNEDILFENVDNGKTLLDIIFAKNTQFIFFVSDIKKHPEIIEYIIKYNKYELVSSISEEICELLFQEHNGMILVDRYIFNEEIMKHVANMASLEAILNYCCVREDYDIFKYYYCDEDELLEEKDEDSNWLEYLLDLEIKDLFFINYYYEKDTIDIIVKKGRFDLLHKASIELLLSKYDEDRLYIDLMNERHLLKEDVYFEKMNYSLEDASGELLADLLIWMAKNDVVNFVPIIDADYLLQKDKNSTKTLLEIIVEKDKDSAYKILTWCEGINNPTFMVILKNLGLDNFSYDLRDDNKDYSSELVDLHNNSIDFALNDELELLLKELQELFHQDSKSSKKLINLIVLSYRKYANINADFAIKELKQLIAIKRTNLDYFILIESDDDEFNEYENSVKTKGIIQHFNHEIAHAFHYYLTQNRVPDDYYEIADRVRNNYDTLKKVESHSESFSKFWKSVESTIKKSDLEKFYAEKYEGEKIVELAVFLANIKDKIRDELKDQYHPQVLDTILATSFSIEEYIAERIKIEVEKTIAVLFKKKYYSYVAISDIIDAIFLGKYLHFALRNEDGNYIPGNFGHGIEYYNYSPNCFIEMFACYCAIIKSEDSKEMIEYLRNIVGDEIMLMLQSFYEDRILGARTFIDEEENTHAK